MDLFSLEEKSENSLGKLISDIASPVLPFLVGNCFLTLFLKLLFILRVDVTVPHLYQVLALFNGEIYLVIPFLLGASACKRFETKVIPGLFLVAVLLLPSLKQMGMSLHGIIRDPQSIVEMQLGIFPLLLVIFLYSKLERKLGKIRLHKVFQWMVPYVAMLIVLFAVKYVVVPAGTFFDNLFSVGILTMFVIFPLGASAILGLLSPILLLFGFLYGSFPATFVFQQLDEAGFLIGPALLGACVCQGTVAICMAFKESNKTMQRKEIVCGTLGFFLFLTPVLLAINIRNKKVFAAGLVGGCFTGIYYGIFGVIRLTNTVHLIIGLILGILCTLYSVHLLQPETEPTYSPSIEEQDTLTKVTQQYRIK